MGNSDIRELAVIEEIEESDIEGKVAAVDAYNWLYKYVTTTVQWTDTDVYTTDEGVELPNILGGVRGIPRFFENDITPIFVFDGAPRDEKSDELEERRSTRSDAAEKAEAAKEKGDIAEAARMDARSQRLTSEMIEATKELFDCLNIEYITAPRSGESQAAHLVTNGPADYVISDDYDTLLFGASATIRNFTSSSKSLEWLGFNSTLTEHEFTHTQLVDVALLCGTDYNDGIHGYGPKTAVSAIAEGGDIETVLADSDSSVEYVDELREIFLSPDVTDIELDSSTPSPNIDETEEFLINECNFAKEDIESALDRLTAATQQTGLDQW